MVQSLVKAATKSAFKNITLTATQKTVATVAGKVIITGATTAGVIGVNNKIRESGSIKLAKKAEESANKYNAGEISAPMTDDQIAKEAKKISAKANIASGAVAGTGIGLSTLLEMAIAAI